MFFITPSRTFRQSSISFAKYALALGMTSAFAPQALACYTVYDRSNQVIYHAATPPINMSYQIHERLPAVFPDGHMVFSITQTDCPLINTTGVRSEVMLTNVAGTAPAARRTARRDRE